MMRSVEIERPVRPTSLASSITSPAPEVFKGQAIVFLGDANASDIALATTLVAQATGLEQFDPIRVALDEFHDSRRLDYWDLYEQIVEFSPDTMRALVRQPVLKFLATRGTRPVITGGFVHSADHVKEMLTWFKANPIIFCLMNDKSPSNPELKRIAQCCRGRAVYHELRLTDQHRVREQILRQLLKHNLVPPGIL